MVPVAESSRLRGRLSQTADARFLIGTGLAVAVTYVVAARLGFRFALVAEQVTTVWAPTGIGLAALLLWGTRLWPAIWIGAFVANAGSTAPLWTAAAVATGNTLEAVAGTWTLHRVAGFDPRLRRLRDVVSFVVIGGVLATTVSATIGVATLCASGVQSWDRFAQLWRDWYLGDAVGALIVAPVILTAARHPSWTPLRRAEAIVLLGGAVLATHVVFGQVFGPTTANHPLEYVIFPFVIAAAVRGGPPVTSIVVLGASAVTIWNTVRGAGPFAGPELHESLILLQAFMGVLAGTGLMLAAAIAERETGERRRAAAYAVGEILATAPDLASASPGILRGLCENLEWDVGTLWLVEPGDQHLTCLAVWTGHSLDVGAFESATREARFKSGVGLPGRVWATGKAVWIENVVADANFPRAAVARDVGLGAAFGFPICLGEDVLGVIECFRRSVEPPDPDLLRTMSAVGSQVGQFVGRKREESAAAAANRAKDEFLATLSHELRTPLHAIVGWTRMLLDGTMDPQKSRHALEVIDRNAQLQAQLVADILDVSRIITGKLRLELRPVDVGPVIAAAVDAVRPAAQAKQVQLRTRFDAVSRVVRGDPRRLQQMIWNLLANAVKFTEAGGTASVTLRDGGTRGLQIRVADDGAGIDPEFLPHVFERFRQADGSVSRLHGGLGLGLAIVRHLAELHGGTVRAESAGPGKGAVFTVELPVSPAAALPLEARDPGATAPDDTEPRPLSGYRLLVVDDQPDARDLMVAMLTAAGAEVASAASAADALHILDTMSPHALLADIGMPGSDGYSLIREVRRRDSPAGRLPAAAITAYAGEHDRDRAVAAGFDCHVPKPVSRAAIVAAVRTICRAQDGTS